MRLLELEPEWMQWSKDPTGQVHLPKVATLADAHGILFVCPKCIVTNGGRIGTHSAICWFRGRVPDEATPGPGRWNVSGTDFNDLTLSPSIQLIGGCSWHGFIRNGGIES